MKAVRALFGEFRTGQGLKGQLLRGGFWSLVIKLMSTLMALVLAVVLARLLGAEGFGVYSFVLALVTILAIPAQMGLPNLVVRETAKAQVAERWDVMKGLWRWSSLVALAMSAGLIGLGALAAWLLADRLGAAQTQALWWGLLLVPLVALGNLRGAALRGLRKVVQGQLPEFVLRPLFLIILALVAAHAWGLSLGPTEAMMFHAVAALAAFLIGAWLLLRERPVELAAQTGSTAEGKIWLASALPLALIGGMQVVNQNVGVVVLGLFRSADEVGLFRVALQGAAFVTFGLAATKTLVAPYYARLYSEGDGKRLQRLVTINARCAFAFALPVVVTFWLWGEDLMSMLLGPEFAAAHLPLVIVCVGQLINTSGASIAVLLNMTGHEKVTSRHTLACSGLTIILSFFLVPMTGLLGAALASAVSLVVWQLLMWQSARKHLGIDSSLIGRHPVGRESGNGTSLGVE